MSQKVLRPQVAKFVSQGLKLDTSQSSWSGSADSDAYPGCIGWQIALFYWDRFSSRFGISFVTHAQLLCMGLIL